MTGKVYNFGHRGGASAGTRDASDTPSDRSITMQPTVPGAPRQSLMYTDCLCGANHQVIIAERLGDTPNCWNWGNALSKDGYGVLTHAGRKWTAHRLSYIAFVGPVPQGFVLDHLCENRACVNPNHLQATTDRVNILRGYGAAALNARKTVCKYGHELPPLAPGMAYRRCETCIRDYALRKPHTILAPDDPRHGTTNGYGNLRCRCAPCCRANTIRHGEYMARRRAAIAQVAA